MPDFVFEESYDDSNNGEDVLRWLRMGQEYLPQEMVLKTHMSVGEAHQITSLGEDVCMGRHFAGMVDPNVMGVDELGELMARMSV